MRHMVPPAKRQMEPGKTTTFEAQWQEGPETISGVAQRKLRLVLGRLPRDVRQPAGVLMQRSATS